jgi:hypothetical protein
MAQVDFYSRNLKSTSAVAILSLLWWQNYSFSLIFIRFGLSKVPFCFWLSSLVFLTWLEVLKVDYCSRI